jgi:hypothetical protein
LEFFDRDAVRDRQPAAEQPRDNDGDKRPDDQYQLGRDTPEASSTTGTICSSRTDNTSPMPPRAITAPVRKRAKWSGVWAEPAGSGSMIVSSPPEDGF